MSDRKPPGVSWESWVERQIREGIERGEFDDLEGTGRRLSGIDGPRDDLWWVKDKLRREEVSALPPTLAVRREVELAREEIARAGSQDRVREVVAAVNVRIRLVNSRATSGPPSTVMPLDPEREVARWRAARAEPA